MPPAVQERVTALAAKTLDISQFLVDKVGVAPIAVGPEDGRIPVTYHDPCHLKKSLGVAAQPRVLLSGQPRLSPPGDARVRLVLRLRRQLQSPALRDLRGHRPASGTTSPRRSCRVVATGCPACMLQITDMASQAGLRLQVKHAVEIYAESLPGSLSAARS